jgi:hypothetical protein
MSLEGQLEDLGLTDIIQILSLSKRSGELSITRQNDSGSVYFSKGQIIFGSLSSVGLLGEKLVKKGIVPNDLLSKALTQQSQGIQKKPLGTILHEMGIDKEVLEKEVRLHISAVVQELLGWKKGNFHFELGTPPGDESIILFKGMSAEYLLLEGARVSDEEGGQDEAGNFDSMGSFEEAPPEAPPPKPLSFQDEIQKEAAIEKMAPEEGNGIRKDLQILNAMIDELSSPSSGGEIILLILRFAGEIFNRTVIFLIKKEEILGWGQCGIVLPGKSSDQEVRRIKIPLSEDSVFKGCLNQKRSLKGKLETNKWNSEMITLLGGEWPGEVLVAPIVSEGRVIAFLYGDNLPLHQPIGATEGLETFIKVAGFAFGKVSPAKKP